MVGQASSLSIKDDGQDAHPAGNLSTARKRLLRFARNDSHSPFGRKLCCHLLGHRVKLIVVLDLVEAFVCVLLAQILLPLQT
jgi:hypothetical protein